MATVYLADDRRLGRRVAVKMMHPHLADDENFTRRFEQEAKSSAGLSHTNVVNVFDQGEAGGVPYLVMEYLPGITLRELLKRQRQLTAEQASEIGEAVLAGLAAAHESGIVHRDLKPENVLLADDGRIKIADFGLARAVSANTTTGQALLGTIAYLSPELVTRGIADERSDLYAFGIMMFEMLTGQQPYTGEQPMQIAYQHAHSDVPLPSTLSPEVTPELDQLVSWNTRRDPDDRPVDARHALEYMRTLRTVGPHAATSVLPATTVLQPTSALTPSTTVLSDAAQHAIAASLQEDRSASANPSTPPANSSSQAGAAVSRAKRIGARRTRKGRWLATAAVLLIALAAGTGFWWGHGPGSTVPVPDVEAMEIEAAQLTLETASLVVERFECSSLEIEAGLAARTEPEAGERVERGSTVRLCQSSGPELLAVPPLIGMSADEARSAIEQERFTFGEITEQRFDGGVKNTVILAVNPAGEGLGELYPEGAVINLIVSAGTLPSVEGLSVADASRALEDAGLTVASSLNDEAHHETVEEGRVIQAISFVEVLSVGDSVGLVISLGPELFEVPDVSEMSLQAAMDTLAAAGFDPTTAVPDPLRAFAKATGTNPAAGERVKAGTTIQVRATIDL